MTPRVKRRIRIIFLRSRGLSLSAHRHEQSPFELRHYRVGTEARPRLAEPDGKRLARRPVKRLQFGHRRSEVALVERRLGFCQPRAWTLAGGGFIDAADRHERPGTP